MYQKTFVCLCRRTNCRIHAIFNTIDALSDINNIYQFQKHLRNIYESYRLHKLTDRQTNRMHKHFLTFLERNEKTDKINEIMANLEIITFTC